MLFGPKKSYMLDYDTLSDPRIAEFLSYGLVTGRFVVPEPPAMSNDESADHCGRRAWEAIERMKKIRDITVKLDKNLMKRDQFLSALRRSKATLITTSPELKAAAAPLPAITTIEIYNLFRPAYLPGTELKVRVAKKGKEKNEGIGYLEGGIKVVVDNAAGAVGSELEVVITGALDTDVGRVVFAKPRFAEVR
jgi:uncharacterized protein YacL